MKSLSEFYQKHGISPVRQDIKALDIHFYRREALYRQLGILPGAIEGQRVLEVGPGSGFNSLYTASLKPSSFVLLEPNPKGVEDIIELFSDFEPWKAPIEIVSSLLADYECTQTFDFVFCEGVLGQIPDPLAFIEQLGACVAPGGVLVISCVDYISTLPDLSRRLLVQLRVDPNDSLEEQVRKTLPMFSPHLRKLEGMSRLHTDWLIDTCLVPASIGRFVTFPEVIEACRSTFDFFSSAPHFVTDWRWYKKITDVQDNFGYNQNAIDCYWSNVHSFLDHSRLFPARDPRENRRFHESCKQVSELLKQYEDSREPSILESFRVAYDEILVHVSEFSPEVAQSIREFRDWIAAPSLDDIAVAESDSFGRLFGRGQQCLSFVRRLD